MQQATQTRTLHLQEPFEIEPKFILMCELTDHIQSPRVVRVKLRSENQQYNEYQQNSYSQGYTAGIWWPTPSGNFWNAGSYRSGALRFRFGSTPGIIRDNFADLREGEYNIPPCQTVQVSAAWWSPRRDYGDDHSIPLEVSIEVATGEAIESTPLVLTCSRLIEGLGSEIDRACWVPPGAYAFDAAAGGQPVMITNSAGMYCERDPMTGKWVPPTTPILLGATRALDVWPGAAFTGEDMVSFQPVISFFIR